mmetsp:Transcript_15542/g.38496  ORF Transcript_15542/g.38496 Transcript_15542/m.38496 type:complete len:215 (+) Transcript_15542:650-1294(+)
MVSKKMHTSSEKGRTSKNVQSIDVRPVSDTASFRLRSRFVLRARDILRHHVRYLAPNLHFVGGTIEGMFLGVHLPGANPGVDHVAGTRHTPEVFVLVTRRAVARFHFALALHDFSDPIHGRVPIVVIQVLLRDRKMPRRLEPLEGPRFADAQVLVVLVVLLQSLLPVGLDRVMPQHHGSLLPGSVQNVAARHSILLSPLFFDFEFDARWCLLQI